MEPLQRGLDKRAVAVTVAVGVVLFIFGIWRFILPPQVEITSGGRTQESVVPGAVESSFLIEDSVVGTGKEALTGSRLTVHYVGRLTDGRVFSSSREEGQPFVFDLGRGQVIRGFETGVSGMREGGRRKLVVPPSLGYGANAVGLIPPDSTLIFDIELLKVE